MQAIRALPQRHYLRVPLMRDRRASRVLMLVAVVAVGILFAACGSGVQSLSNGPHPAATASAAESGPLAPQLGRVPIVNGPFGSSDTSAYPVTGRPSLAWRPSVSGDFVARLTSESTYLGLRKPEQLARVSRVVVLAKVVSFGSPRWNSQDGSFWATRFIPDSAGTPVANTLYTDVNIDVLEVIGEALPGDLKPGPLTYSVPGGQAVVVIPPDAASLDPSYLPAGRYLWDEPSAVDLKAGQEVVLFLDYQALYGLYDGKYGYVTTLMPASDAYYAFTQDGDLWVNAAAGLDGSAGPFVLTLGQLRDLAQGDIFAAVARNRPMPDGMVHSQPASHGDEPIVQPADEQGGGPVPSDEGAISLEPKP